MTPKTFALWPLLVGKENVNDKQRVVFILLILHTLVVDSLIILVLYSNSTVIKVILCYVFYRTEITPYLSIIHIISIIHNIHNISSI